MIYGCILYSLMVDKIQICGPFVFAGFILSLLASVSQKKIVKTVITECFGIF